MADHGYWVDNRGRQNPILYIKGINEHHEMKISDLPISYEDLCDAFLELLNNRKSEELFSNINVDRIRRFIYNSFEGENHMVEYVVKGKAWESDKVEATGVEYNR